MAIQDTKPLTGRHVFWMLAAFFGVMIIVNVIFTVLAVQSFTGEDVPKSYRQGLEYNQTIQARQNQSEKGWTISANHFAESDATRIVIKLEDANGNPLSDLNVSGTLRHPTDKAFDQSITFENSGFGRYTASAQIAPGQWQLKAEALGNYEQPIRFTHDIWVK